MMGVAILPTLFRTLLNRGMVPVLLIECHSGINFSIGQAFKSIVKRPSVINMSVRILAYHCKRLLNSAIARLSVMEVRRSMKPLQMLSASVSTL